jgi:hypothetical protein
MLQLLWRLLPLFLMLLQLQLGACSHQVCRVLGWPVHSPGLFLVLALFAG